MSGLLWGDCTTIKGATSQAAEASPGRAGNPLRQVSGVSRDVLLSAITPGKVPRADPRRPPESLPGSMD